MGRKLPECEAPSTVPTLAPESGSKIAPNSESDWFAPAAQALLGKDAGLHLHYITGYPESSCYAYVARDPAKRRRPPEHFIRALIRSPQGEPFFLAFMDGCEAPWWQAHLRLCDESRQLQEIRRIVSG